MIVFNNAGRGKLGFGFVLRRFVDGIDVEGWGKGRVVGVSGIFGVFSLEERSLRGGRKLFLVFWGRVNKSGFEFYSE